MELQHLQLTLPGIKSHANHGLTHKLECASCQSYHLRHPCASDFLSLKRRVTAHFGSPTPRTSGAAMPAKVITQEKALQAAGVSFAVGVVVGWLAHRSLRRVRPGPEPEERLLLAAGQLSDRTCCRALTGGTIGPGTGCKVVQLAM